MLSLMGAYRYLTVECASTQSIPASSANANIQETLIGYVSVRQSGRLTHRTRVAAMHGS